METLSVIGYRVRVPQISSNGYVAERQQGFSVQTGDSTDDAADTCQSSRLGSKLVKNCTIVVSSPALNRRLTAALRDK
jgi:hypothetical protein